MISCRIEQLGPENKIVRRRRGERFMFTFALIRYTYVCACTLSHRDSIVHNFGPPWLLLRAPRINFNKIKNEEWFSSHHISHLSSRISRLLRCAHLVSGARSAFIRWLKFYYSCIRCIFGCVAVFIYVFAVSHTWTNFSFENDKRKREAEEKNAMEEMYVWHTRALTPTHSLQRWWRGVRSPEQRSAVFYEYLMEYRISNAKA